MLLIPLEYVVIFVIKNNAFFVSTYFNMRAMTPFLLTRLYIDSIRDGYLNYSNKYL